MIFRYHAVNSILNVAGFYFVVLFCSGFVLGFFNTNWNTVAGVIFNWFIKKETQPVYLSEAYMIFVHQSCIYNSLIFIHLEQKEKYLWLLDFLTLQTTGLETLIPTFSKQ